jgi:small subunit ribosomal protein S8
MPALWPTARGIPEVRHLPDLLPEFGQRRCYSWRQKGELVKGPLNMMTDPIADMLTRIRNAVRIERPQVNMPSSKVKRGLAEVLKREGFIWDWTEEEIEAVAGKQLRIELKYGPNGERLIQHIKRVSKPGRRVYSRAVELRPVLNGLGISIISTSRGVISDREARQRKLGGEVLCELW